MSYDSQLSNDNKKINTLFIIRPRIRASGFSLVSGSIYSATFNTGYVSQVSVNDNGINPLLPATSPSLSAGQFFFDFTNSILYIRKHDSSAVSANDWVVVTYELYFAEKELIWPRVPTSLVSESVVYRGLLLEYPQNKKRSSDNLFGFNPIESTSASIINDPDVFRDFIFSSSFNDAECVTYHLIGSLDADNFKQIHFGLCGNINIDDSKISFQIFDSYRVFDKKIQNPTSASYYYDVGSSSMDPSYVGKPIRSVYGFVQGFVPVNLNYTIDNPTTSDNRNFGVVKRMFSPLTTAGSITTQLTNFDWVVPTVHAARFAPGDNVWVETNSASFQTSVIQTVNYSTGDISISPGVAFTFGGASFSKAFVTNVYMIQGNVKHNFKYGRDYTVLNHNSDVSGFSLLTTAEANVGANTLDPSSDFVFCDVHGENYEYTANTISFGMNKHGTSYFDNGLYCLYDFLRRFCDLTPDVIDSGNIESLSPSIKDSFGFAIPESASSDFPERKNVLLKMMQSLLLKSYISDSGDITFKLTAPTGSSTTTISDADIINNSFGYEFDYNDLNSIKVNADFREVYLKGPKDAVLGGTVDSDFVRLDNYHNLVVTSSSDAYRFLHRGSKEFEVDTYLFASASVSLYASRLKYLLGDRSGKFKFRIKNQLMLNGPGDVLDVSHVRMPGFNFVAGSESSRSGVILDIDKSVAGIEVLLDDQKGIDDNRGSW